MKCLYDALKNKHRVIGILLYVDILCSPLPLSTKKLKIDPGPQGSTAKRFDARMSPAHARLVMLASEMDKGGGNTPNQHNGGGGGGGFTPSMDIDTWNLQDNREDFNFEDELANWDKHSQARNESLGQSRKAPVGGKWSKVEDDQLKSIVEAHGPRNWKNVAELLGPTRSDVQCLHRWNKVLKPGLLKVCCFSHILTHKTPYVFFNESLSLGTVDRRGR